MNVRFIGCPSSGKTTVATLAFSRLKESGMAAEFLPEAARIYIANKRVKRGLKPTDKLELNDADQFAILEQQAQLENLMMEACGREVIIVSDAWSMCSLLYMQDATLADPRLNILLNDYCLPCRGDLVMYCAPVPHPSALDPNRVHNEAQAFEIDKKIPAMLSRFAPGVKVVALDPSTPDHRANLVIAAIFDHLRG